MVKRKPIKFEDTRGDNVTTRQYQTHRVGLEHTSSNTIYFNCPFCEDEIKAYVWSLCGGGKRCPGCGALFGGHGNGYQFTDLIKNNEEK